MSERPSGDCDVIVVGAGCAGLSTACHLIDAGLDDRRVLLLDPRTEYAEDRTWCFWDVEGHPFLPLAEHSWTRWEILGPEGERVVQASGKSPYRMIGARRFYETALSRLREAGYELALGERVSEITPERGGIVEVTTSRRRVRAPMVVDTRWTQGDPHQGTNTPRLVQHFVGHVVSADAPVFDPGCATLMDFTPASRDIHFFYVLPFDERHALVESTGISWRPRSRREHEARLSGYLASRWAGTHFETLRRESGVIPMDVLPPEPRRHSGIVPLGMRGGAVRASTGYAFLGIQRQAAAFAGALSAGRAIPDLAPHGARSRMLDGIFLSLAKRRPRLLPQLLTRLFRDAEPDRLVRFLSGRGSLIDDVHVVAKMKARPMLREAALMLAGA